MDVVQRLQTAAAEVLASRPVEFAYLFGSHARGEARAGSDVLNEAPCASSGAYCAMPV